MKVFKAALFFTFFFNLYVLAQQQNKIIIYPDSIIKSLSPLLTGACIEDVNHEIYGGLYSQMLFGESFQELPMKISPAINPGFAGITGYLSCKAPRTELRGEPDIRSWQPAIRGSALGLLSIDTEHPFVGKQGQRMKFISGTGSIAIENRGLNREGLHLSGKKDYEGKIYAKAGKLTRLYISLESEDGFVVYAETSIIINGAGWKKYNFRFTPNRSAIHARFSLSLHKPGEVTLGYVFLQPGNWGLYKNLPLRKDVVEGLLKEKITVMRYGGSMTLDSNYRWKNMIGEREKRPPYGNIWYPCSTNGWGIIDFMNMCGAMDITGIPDFNSHEKPGDMADFIEYENGSADTFWGKKRIADGHPAPYYLKYIELGNEEFLNKELAAKFMLMADAIWRKDPTIQIVFCVSDNTHEDAKSDLPWFKQTIDNCRQHGHRAWFDVHIFNDDEKEPDLTELVFAEKQLLSIAPDTNFRLCIFEENANNARMKRGLGHANAINRIERLPYEIPIMCAANCLQVDRQNDNGWDQGLLFLNPENVWGQPSYYVSQMAAENYLPLAIKTGFTGASDALDITALKSNDGKIVSLQVVNYKATTVDVQIILNSYKLSATVTELNSMDIDAWNTAEEPYNVVPHVKFMAVKSNKLDYSFAPFSYTVFKFR